MADWSDKIIVIGVGNVDTDAIKDAIIDKIGGQNGGIQTTDNQKS